MLAKNAPHLMRPIASVAEFAGSEITNNVPTLIYYKGGGPFCEGGAISVFRIPPLIYSYAADTCKHTHYP